jgi:hypothetical protein
MFKTEEPGGKTAQGLRRSMYFILHHGAIRIMYMLLTTMDSFCPLRCKRRSLQDSDAHHTAVAA